MAIDHFEGELVALRIESNFPQSNVAVAEVSRDERGEVVSFAAATHGGPETLWFYFRIVEDTPPPPGTRLRLVLKHSENLLCGHVPEWIRPVVRTPEVRGGVEDGWQRLGRATVEELHDGRKHLIWDVEHPRSALEIAVCYPYGAAELNRLLQDHGGYWRADTIGVSQGDRPIDRLSNDGGTTDAALKKPGLYLLARQHSGETPGSWVLDGVLRAIAERSVRDVLIWCVPFANIDGVEQGDYGKDNYPYDLNRAWGSAPMRHETLVIQRDARRWYQRCRARAFFDFHAPGLVETTGIYSFASKPEKLSDQALAMHIHWLGGLRVALDDDGAAHFGRVGRYASRWDTPTSKDFFGSLDGVFAATLECSYVASGEEILTRERYQAAGRRLGEALLKEAKKTKP